jgi:hypothetical protein
MATLFQATASVKKAIIIINDLDSSKYSRILTRVLQRIHLKEERIFSEEEEGKLQSVFGLDIKDVQLLIEVTTFILEQAAYHLAKPDTLSKQLQSLGLEEDKCSLFSQAWTSQSKSVIERLRNRTFYPKQLESVNWRLNLSMAQSSQSKLKQPNAQFELGVRDGEITEKVRMEFTHEELYQFFTQLESVQEQLDSLST